MENQKPKKPLPLFVWILIVLVGLFILVGIINGFTRALLSDRGVISDRGTCGEKVNLTYFSSASGEQEPSWYYKGCGKVYFQHGSFGSNVQPVPADRETFVVVSQTTGKDQFSVFSQTTSLPVIDPATFQIAWCDNEAPQSVWFDKRNAYFANTMTGEVSIRHGITPAQIAQRADCSLPYQ